MPSGLSETREQLETVAGVAATFVIGYIPPVVFSFLLLAALGQRQWAWSVLTGAGLVFSLVMAVWVTQITAAAPPAQPGAGSRACLPPAGQSNRRPRQTSMPLSGAVPKYPVGERGLP